VGICAMTLTVLENDHWSVTLKSTPHYVERVVKLAAYVGLTYLHTYIQKWQKNVRYLL